MQQLDAEIVEARASSKCLQENAALHEPLVMVLRLDHHLSVQVSAQAGAFHLELESIPLVEGERAFFPAQLFLLNLARWVMVEKVHINIVWLAANTAQQQTVSAEGIATFGIV